MTGIMVAGATALRMGMRGSTSMVVKASMADSVDVAAADMAEAGMAAAATAKIGETPLPRLTKSLWVTLSWRIRQAEESAERMSARWLGEASGYP
jgi:hypothetical protein